MAFLIVLIQLISVHIGFSQFSPVQSTPTRIEQLLQLEDVFPIKNGDIAMLVYQTLGIQSPSENGNGTKILY